MGKDDAFLQGGLVEEGFKDAAGAARGGGNVHLHAGPIPVGRCIPHISHHLAGTVVNYHGGQIGHALFGQFVALPVGDGRYGFLQLYPEGGAGSLALLLSLYIVRGQGGKRQGGIGKRFFQGRGIGIGPYVPVLQQPFQQPIPLLQQFFPALPQVQGGGGVGKHRQGGGFGPGEFRCRPSEITPGGGFQPHHIAPEGRMGGIHGQDGALPAPQLQSRSQHGLYEFLGNGALLVPAQPYHLHREGTAPAHHVTASEVLHQGPSHRHGVHARMPPELPVFKLYQRRGKAPWHRVARREAPLPIGRNPRAQQFPLGTLHHRGVHRILEQVPRQAKQPRQKRGCHNANPYYLSA